MSDTAARLAEYRRKREEAEAQAKRSEAVWNALTFAPLRRRLAATLAVNQEDQQADEGELRLEGEEGLEEIQEEEPGWSTLDWVILAVKVFKFSFNPWKMWKSVDNFNLQVLVYASLQALFIKLEFGAVFFLASGVLIMWQSLENRKR